MYIYLLTTSTYKKNYFDYLNHQKKQQKIVPV